MPHHIKPGTFVALDGNQDDVTVQLDKLWRAAHGLGLSSTPLLDRLPVFTERPAEPADEAEHWRQVVAPELADGGAVFMHGAYVTRAGGTPTVTFIVNPSTNPEPNAVVLLGDDGEVGEGMFAELIERGLYFGRQPKSSGR